MKTTKTTTALSALNSRQVQKINEFKKQFSIEYVQEELKYMFSTHLHKKPLIPGAAASSQYWFVTRLSDFMLGIYKTGKAESEFSSDFNYQNCENFLLEIFLGYISGPAGIEIGAKSATKICALFYELLELLFILLMPART